jgi:putative transposase
MSKQLTREQKAQEIASVEGAIKFVTSQNTYVVKSQSKKGAYYVTNTELGWRCTCPDHEYRGVQCKHILAVEIRFALHREVEVARIAPLANVSQCIYCKCSKIVKDGIRHNKLGDIQKFQCRRCRKYFTINIGFEKMKHSPQGITTAMQLYFSGESLRNTCRSLKLIGVDVAHQTIYRWIEKYTELMQTYLEKITPSVSNAWRADELYLKIKGNNKYLYALMDDETRFWIAQQVAHTKNTADVSPLLAKGKEITKTRPKTFITDGGHNFHTAYEKELYTVKGLRTKHIKHIRLQGDMNNNKMERMNGEVRDREKTMRGLKKMDTPILKGYQLYHNYIRAHEALDGKTPAEKCGIKIEGKNKWITLIQNSITKN